MNTKLYGIGMIALVVGVAFAPSAAAQPTCPPEPGQTLSDTVQACLALAIALLIDALGDASAAVAQLVADAQAAIADAGGEVDTLIGIAELLAQGVVVAAIGLVGDAGALVAAVLAFIAGIVAFAGCSLVGPPPCVLPSPPA